VRPLISIIIPTYNRDAQLRDAVESVFAQTYRDWELLVIDDGSADGTRAYLDTLTDARVRPLLHDHCGNPALLRNVAARAAKGSYFAFLDSDDAWRPTKLTVQVEDLLAHPECGWSYTGYVHMDEQGRGDQWRSDRPWVPYAGWILDNVITVQAMIAMPTVMVERRLFEAIGGFDEAVHGCEDYDLAIRLAEASPATVVPTPLAKKRQHFEDRPTNQVELLKYMNRMYSGLLARTTSSRLRRMCRRQRTRFDLRFVDRFRGAGRYREARQALWISFPYAGWHPGWWIALLKTWFRPLIPGGLLSLYSRASQRQDLTRHT
jgi:glycosyltransferase involved in cell wall biosynthesis